MASENIENYLKNIYKIQHEEGRVTTSSLSTRLQISPASVSEMVRKLASDGHVHHRPYKGVELTKKGRERALRIIRRHRLWELFLVEVLKYDWDEIDEEAERLEHITSERLEQRIDQVLGYPSHDPHGHAIPSSDGTLVEDDHSLLSGCAAGETLVVRRVNDASAEILQYASRAGLSLGARITVLERIRFDGSLRIRVGRHEQYVSEKLSQHIHVEHLRKRTR